MRADDHQNFFKIASDTISQGRTIGFTTDTVWGVGAAPYEEQAVRRIYEQKQRPDDKALQVLCAEPEVAASFVSVPDGWLDAWARVVRLWPGALTLVVPAGPRCPSWLTRDGKVGLRVPDSPFTLRLLRACGGALAATSLNRSGQPPALTYEEAVAAGVADVVLPGEPAGGLASTVYDLTDDRVLRAGAMPEEAIRRALWRTS